MTQTPPSVEIEEAGPVEKFEFQFEGPGITVLHAPNGSGKSIVLDAVSTAAAGKGKIPLRDDATRGHVRVAGATITLSSQTRHAGVFDVEHLEGRFDLAQLVDPGIKDPEAADRRRIAALVALSGGDDPACDAFLKGAFAEHYKDWDTVVSPQARQADNLVELAAKVKRAYELQARSSSDSATMLRDRIHTLREAVKDVDLTRPDDEAELMAALKRAIDVQAGLVADADAHSQSHTACESAKLLHDELVASYVGETVDASVETLRLATEALAESSSTHRECKDEYDAACTSLSMAANNLDAARKTRDNEQKILEHAEKHVAMLASSKEIIDAAVLPGPPADMVELAELAFHEKTAAVGVGLSVRTAKEKVTQADDLAKQAVCHEKAAATYRDSASRTEDVLAAAIKSDVFKVTTIGERTRLVVSHARGDNTPFSELSPGEAYRLAVDWVASKLGEGALVVINQVAWEGIDVFIRPEVASYVQERGLFALTAEATRDTELGRDMQAKLFAKE